MKTCIISYSMTGNNEALAKRLASSINASHICVNESGRKMGKTILDMIFGRVPKVQPDASVIDDYDEVILAGPVWMGKAASPLRPYLLHIKKNNRPFKFITISGGALNKNPGLQKDLCKYGGEKLLLLKDMYISDLLGKTDADTKETSEYKLTHEDLNVLEKAIAQEL